MLKWNGNSTQVSIMSYWGFQHKEREAMGYFLSIGLPKLKALK